MTPKYPNLVDPAPRNEPNQTQIHPRTDQSTRIWSWDSENLAERGGDLTNIGDLARVGNLGECVPGNLRESQPTEGVSNQGKHPL